MLKSVEKCHPFASRGFRRAIVQRRRRQTLAKPVRVGKLSNENRERRKLNSVSLGPRGHGVGNLQTLQIHHGNLVLPVDGYVRAGTIGDDHNARCGKRHRALYLFVDSRI